MSTSSNGPNSHKTSSVACFVNGQRLPIPGEGFWVNEPPYGLRDPSVDERRVLFEFEVDAIATFGRP